MDDHTDASGVKPCDNTRAPAPILGGKHRSKKGSKKGSRKAMEGGKRRSKKGSKKGSKKH